MEAQYSRGYELARAELRELLAKNRDYPVAARLAIAISWAGSDLHDMIPLIGADDDDPS